jgi:hypothetical protein
VQPPLAGVVHDSQSADYEHRYGKADQYGGFHCEPPAAGHRGLPAAEVPQSKNELKQTRCAGLNSDRPNAPFAELVRLSRTGTDLACIQLGGSA